MAEHWRALLYAAIAGSTIPLGGLIALREHIHPDWLEAEFRHTVIAFGGGVLIAAVALVLVPEGVQHLSPLQALLSFGAGGLFFFWLDWQIEKSGGAGAMLLAMLIDYLPESLALGAMLATGAPAALLLALLIALQNLPEGFNACRELSASGRMRPAVILALFLAVMCLGPLAALIGYVHLADRAEGLGCIMLFAAAGILFLTFQDVAPQARLERHWAPSLGAVAGFMLGLFGDMVLG